MNTQFSNSSPNLLDAFYLREKNDANRRAITECSSGEDRVINWGQFSKEVRRLVSYIRSLGLEKIQILLSMVPTKQAG